MPPGRVTVRRVPGKEIGKDSGETAIYTDGKFVIFINKSKRCFQCNIDTILHEWSHLLTWFKYGGEREDHTSEWGVIHARIYREHCKWDFGRKEKGQKRKPLPGQKQFHFVDEIGS